MLCDNCDKHSDDLNNTPDGWLCPDCFDSDGLTQCCNCSNWVDDAIEYDRDTYCPECFDDMNLTQCDGCCEWFEVGSIVVESYCEDCAVEKDYFRCHSCDEWHHIDEANSYKDDMYCEACFSGMDLYFCEGCEEYVEDGCTCGNHTYCMECAHYNGWYQCEHCGCWEEDTHCAWDTVYCSDCFYDRFSYCDDCGEVVENDDCIQTDDGTYCAGCMPNDDMGDFDPSFRRMRPKKYDRVGSNRQYGVELETHRCPNYMNLNRSGWGAKDDGSINGKEFVTAIFNGNAGLNSIRKVCEFAHNNDWTVDYRCGYHLHLNMKDESIDSLKAIAHAYHVMEDIWESFVAPRRSGYMYCAHLEYSCDDVAECYDISDWRRFCDRRNRSVSVNWRAYLIHKSLEIRLHEGTLDADKVCNWIRAHATFIDWASNLGYEGVKAALECDDLRGLLAEIWDGAGCADLAAYYSLEVCYA